jgi:sec-independent protein translocase protein TatC
MAAPQRDGDPEPAPEPAPESEKKDKAEAVEEPLTHVEPEDDVKMTIWEHLGELRKRAFRGAAALLAGTIACWTYKDTIFSWLTRPYASAWFQSFPELAKQGKKPELTTLAPADIFVNYLQLSMVGGLILSAPIIFWQLWAFVSPGLYSREKKYIIPFVLFSTTLFVGGVAFAYYVALPFTFPFFFSMHGAVGSDGLTIMPNHTMEMYLDFAEHMLLAFGFVFELPIFIGFLALAGIVTPRPLVRCSRYAILAAFVVGAFVTPTPDWINQTIVSGALVVLYFISVGIAFIVAKRRD